MPENVELVRAVYDELHGAQPRGFDMRRSARGRRKLVHLVETEEAVFAPLLDASCPGGSK